MACAGLLVEDHKGHFLLEWPRQQLVEVTPTEHKEERHVRVAPGAVAVRVDARSHVVAVFACVKRGRVDRQVAAGLRLCQPLSPLVQLPNEHSVRRERLERRHTSVQLLYAARVVL